MDTSHKINILDKLEIFKDICSNDTELDQILEKLLGITLSRHQQRLDRYEQNLSQFENRYGMDSATFYKRFEAGQLGDATDFFEWASFYELRQELLNKIRRLESVL